VAKTLTDVKTALEGLGDDGQELYQAVDSAILHERNMGKGLAADAQKKADAMRAALAKIGYNDAAGMDLNEYITTVQAKLEKSQDAFQKLSKEEQNAATLKGQLEKMQADLEKTREEAKTFQSGLQNATLRSALKEKLSGKIYSEDLHADAIISKGLAVLGTDNQTIQWKDGDALISLDDGIGKYFDANKDSLINNQRSGPGNGPNDAPNPGKTKRRAEYEQMHPNEVKEFLADGGSFVD